ncbi:hypothetical protein BGZ82_004714 [Podila clonocystis]|nr:hypothetical protein BGZ82_004714 [Podila clonocystis]
MGPTATSTHSLGRKQLQTEYLFNIRQPRLLSQISSGRFEQEAQANSYHSFCLDCEFEYRNSSYDAVPGFLKDTSAELSVVVLHGVGCTAYSGELRPLLQSNSSALGKARYLHLAMTDTTNVYLPLAQFSSC